MRPGLQAVVRTRPRLTRRLWLRRLLLAATLVVVVLGIVGMHQMAFGHDLAVGPTAASAAHGEHVEHTGPSEIGPMAAGHAGGHADAGLPGTGASEVCPDCADHQMAFGSCLLALTLLVLSWLLAPPRATRVLPSLLARRALPLALSVVGRLVPPLSLAELSVRRT